MNLARRPAARPQAGARAQRMARGPLRREQAVVTPNEQALSIEATDTHRGNPVPKF